MKKITAGILSVGLILLMVFSSSVLASPEAEDSLIGVAYRGHVENEGNMPKPEGRMVTGPEALGTRGQSLRIEGFWIKLTGDLAADAGISYQVHIQDRGWMEPVKNGDFAGTDGHGLRVESIRINLLNLPDYNVYYRGHVQNRGDLPIVDGNLEDSWGWVKNGAELGTVGECLRLEELQIKIVKKSDLTAYQTLVDEIQALDEATYTPESFKSLQETVINNVVTSDDSQSDVEAVTQAIQQGLDALIRVIDGDLAEAKAAESLLVASDYGDYSGVTAALALPETGDAEIVAKTRTIIDAIEALVVRYDDLRSAALVSNQIEALPEVELVVAADRLAIMAARAAYDQLTIDQQAFISETILAKLRAVEAEVKTESNVIGHEIKVELNTHIPPLLTYEKPIYFWDVSGSITIIPNGKLGKITANRPNGPEIRVTRVRRNNSRAIVQIGSGDIGSIEKIKEIYITIDGVTEKITLD